MRYYSWASLEFTVAQEGKGNKIFTEINSIAYSDSAESELVYGAARNPLGTTDPIYTPADFSFDLFRGWFVVFARDATNNGELFLGDLDFRMVVKHKTRSQAEVGRVDVIDFQIMTAADTASQGPPNLLTNVTCLPTLITRGGVQL